MLVPLKAPNDVGEIDPEGTGVCVVAEDGIVVTVGDDVFAEVELESLLFRVTNTVTSTTAMTTMAKQGPRTKAHLRAVQPNHLRSSNTLFSMSSLSSREPVVSSGLTIAVSDRDIGLTDACCC